ncbi:MAG: hypothetical protein ACJ77K_01020 [Bacteroidia bacterium]
MEDAVKRDAYLKGLKLKRTGLDEETIAIRLEKQGVPYELAKEVAANIQLQRRIDVEDKEKLPSSGFQMKEWAITGMIKDIFKFLDRH